MERFAALFGGPPRKPESPLTQREMDLAASIQKVTEDVVSRLALTARRELDADYLCLAGGVALNCVANGRLVREGTFRDIWIQPAAGDAGGAIGAALAGWHPYGGAPREADGDDRMRGSFLGPSFGEAEIKDALDRAGARYQRLPEAEPLESAAAMLAEGAVVGWFQGRMEFGPRALGDRSILGDPRNSKMQSVMNLKIKYRESFRPFAPAVLVERTAEYFELDRQSPYMALVANVREERRQPMSDEQHKLFGIDKLNVPRSSIPAVTHVDYSARIQSVDARTNPRFHGCSSALPADRMRRDGQHVVQRARRADRVHARRCLPMFHAHRDGCPGARRLPARQDRPARAPARRELEARVRAGLTGGDGASGRGATTQS